MSVPEMSQTLETIDVLEVIDGGLKPYWEIYRPILSLTPFSQAEYLHPDLEWREELIRYYSREEAAKVLRQWEHKNKLGENNVRSSQVLPGRSPEL
jgi:hypothetical protein